MTKSNIAIMTQQTPNFTCCRSLTPHQLKICVATLIAFLPPEKHNNQVRPAHIYGTSYPNDMYQAVGKKNVATLNNPIGANKEKIEFSISS